MTMKPEESQEQQRLKSGVNTRGIALFVVMILLFLGTGVYLASTMKNELHLNVNNKLSGRALRPEQLKKAQKLVDDATHTLASGQAPLAVQQAQEALVVIAQPYSPLDCNRDFALGDIKLLKGLGPIFNSSKAQSPLSVDSIDSIIRIIDEPYLNNNERADLNLALADIAAALGSYYNSMDNVYEAAKNLAAAKQYDQCERLISDREKLPVTNEDDQRTRDVFLGLSRFQLLLARGEKDKAKETASALRSQIGLLKDAFHKYELLHEVADLQMKSGNLAGAAGCFAEAKTVAGSLKPAHPEAYAESTYRLSVCYRKSKQADRARAQLGDLKTYRAQVKDSGLKERISMYLTNEQDALKQATP